MELLSADIHRTTVCSWEIRARAALLAGARQWHGAQQTRLQLDPEPPAAAWRYELHSLRGGATNTQVWQKVKLRASQLHSYYIVDPVLPSDCWNNVFDSMTHLHMMGDLQMRSRQQSQPRLAMQPDSPPAAVAGATLPEPARGLLLAAPLLCAGTPGVPTHKPHSCV